MPAKGEVGSRRNLDMFSAREIEVCQHVANGFTHKEVAGLMGISEHTIAAHVYNIGQKAGLKSVNQAIITRMAVSKGWVTSEWVPRKDLLLGEAGIVIDPIPSDIRVGGLENKRIASNWDKCPKCRENGLMPFRLSPGEKTCCDMRKCLNCGEEIPTPQELLRK